MPLAIKVFLCLFNEKSIDTCLNTLISVYVTCDLTDKKPSFTLIYSDAANSGDRWKIKQ